MPPLGGGQGPCPAVSEPISFHGSSLICWIWHWPKHTATVHTLPNTPFYCISLFIIATWNMCKLKQQIKNRWNEKEKKGETKMNKFTGTETFMELYDQSVKMCLCVCFVFGQMHSPIWDSVSDQSECWCGTDSWAMSYQLVLQPHPSGPALHPFPLHWQHPKQPALITTHPSIRTLLPQARCPPLGR